MQQQISVQGLVVTTPRHLVTQDGLPITSFRVASSQRQFDHTKNRWIDGETNWYTVTAFKQLAINTAGSVNKGDRVVIEGNLRIRDWDNGQNTGTSVEVEATAIGHDLSWGTAIFTRTVLVSDQREEQESNRNDSRVKELEDELKNLRDTLASLAEGE